MINVSAKLSHDTNKAHYSWIQIIQISILIVLVRTAWLIKFLRALLWAPPGTSTRKHLVASRRSTCHGPAHGYLCPYAIMMIKAHTLHSLLTTHPRWHKHAPPPQTQIKFQMMP